MAATPRIAWHCLRYTLGQLFRHGWSRVVCGIGTDGAQVIQISCPYAHIRSDHRPSAVQRLCYTNNALSVGATKIATGAAKPLK